MLNQSTLTAVSEFLDSAGWNYSVFLRAYATPCANDTSSEQLIRSALGTHAVVTDIDQVTTEGVLSEVRSALSYSGDSGAGLDPKAMQSEHFRDLIAIVLADLASTARQATRIERFRLKEGHPAYPVFWDFAFLFTGTVDAVALVGSSSD